MYKIIGADQREYGPVDVEQIRAWIVEGRANGATLVRAEGSTDWRPLSTFPELSALLPGPAAPVPPTTPPPPGMAESMPLPQAPVPGTGTVDIGRCLSRSWQLFTDNAGVLIGATAVFMVVVAIVNQIIGLLTREMFRSLMVGHIQPGAVIGLVLFNIPEMALSGILMGGMYGLLLKLARGQPAGVGDIFAGFRTVPLQLALGGIVVQLLTFIGLLACIAPGIYLSVAWIFTIPLIVDRGLDFWTAMETSRKAVTGYWVLTFCLVLVVALIGVAGVIACCVGILVALPVGLGAVIFAYEDLLGRADRLV
ncbi:MAG: GYF domain-containing protein [Verrucomicrobiota bacterium]